MVTKKDEPSVEQQGNAAVVPAPGPAGPPDPPVSRCGNTILKSGTLLLSSKGIGWTSWKKRWFILTRTSLVFFKSDPSAIPLKGNDVNIILGGIDINNSGSVVAKADKKLLIVVFHDGQDERTFTLKAETFEDLYEWKAAFENAFSRAPISTSVMAKDAKNGSKEPVNDKKPMRTTVLGKPILLALEDADGSPTFLEKALRFVEDHGTKVEGVLRQAADVEHVKRRIWEYEQGKTEFSAKEDPHVIADCVKYVIRELPSSPVPASCCNALLEACRSPSGDRVNAVRVTVLDTFPEPNRRLLQRILMMMQTVASNQPVNLMSPSAVAACMAPLLLRPLLSGECEIENDFDVGVDCSLQLLRAAAAANHAQTIVITLLDDYQTIFGEGFVSPHLYSDSEESGSESEEATDVDCDDATNGSNAYSDNDYEDSDDSSSSSEPSISGEDLIATKKQSSSSLHSQLVENDLQRSEDNQSRNSSTIETNTFGHPPKDVQSVTKMEDKLTHLNQISCISKSTPTGHEPRPNVKRPTAWGWAAARKKLSTECIDFPCKQEAQVEHLEDENTDLQKRFTEEIKGNTIHEANLEEQKRLHGCHLALQKDVSRLMEELQRERDKRTALEAGLIPSQGPVILPDTLDEKTKANLKDIAQTDAEINYLNKKVDGLRMQLNQLLEQNSIYMNDTTNRHQPNHQEKVKHKSKGTEVTLKKSGSKVN